MESNRDDAERCLTLASTALEAGDIAKATRLLEKSRRMYPLHAQQERLFDAIRKSTNSTDTRSTHGASASSSSEKSESAVEEAAPPHREPSQEMIAAVAQIRKVQGKSHYAVLGVPRDCDLNALKKSYRKLALRLHPDRNFAVGADEAFKRVGQAFLILSDPKHREYYDRTGSDEPGQPPRTNIRRRRNGARTHYYTANSFGEFFDTNELTPEELFEFMFSSPTGRGASFRSAPRNFPANPPSLWQRLKPFVLISMFIIISLLVSEDKPTNTFSLNRTRYHTIRRETENHVTYFVSGKLNIPIRSQKRLERQVDLKGLEQYRLLCDRERDHAAYLRRQSRSWFSSKTARSRYREEYENFEQPWCRKTQELHDRLIRYW